MNKILQIFLIAVFALPVFSARAQDLDFSEFGRQQDALEAFFDDAVRALNTWVYVPKGTLAFHDQGDLLGDLPNMISAEIIAAHLEKLPESTVGKVALEGLEKRDMAVRIASTHQVCPSRAEDTYADGRTLMKAVVASLYSIPNLDKRTHQFAHQYVLAEVVKDESAPKGYKVVRWASSPIDLVMRHRRALRCLVDDPNYAQAKANALHALEMQQDPIFFYENAKGE